MKKRMHDIDIWIDCEWFMELSPIDKCAFLFIIDRCDNVGVWKPNFKLAETCINGKPDWGGLSNKVHGNIIVLDCGKWWVPDFCDFQYGMLVDSNRPHQSYIALLKKHGLFERACKPLTSPLQGVKEKDKDLEKDKDKEKEKKYAPGVCMKESAYIDMCQRFGTRIVDSYIEQISDWQKSKGKKPYKDMPATIKNWYRRDKGVGSIKELEIKPPAVCPGCGKSISTEIKHGADHCYSCKAEIGGGR